MDTGVAWAVVHFSAVALFLSFNSEVGFAGFQYLVVAKILMLGLVQHDGRMTEGPYEH